jgi:hypothetical protein
VCQTLLRSVVVTRPRGFKGKSYKKKQRAHPPRRAFVNVSNKHLWIQWYVCVASYCISNGEAHLGVFSVSERFKHSFMRVRVAVCCTKYLHFALSCRFSARSSSHAVGVSPQHARDVRGVTPRLLVVRRAVAVQVDFFKLQSLKPVFHFIGSRVETRRLSSYGSAGFNLYSPTVRSRT